MLHQVSRAYIETALDPAAEARVVISHFVPRLELVAKRHYTKAVGLLHSAYWTTHLPELTARANLWIYGHTHDNISTYIGDTRFVSNQRGYSRIYDQAEQRDYNREHYVLI